VYVCACVLMCVSDNVCACRQGTRRDVTQRVAQIHSSRFVVVASRIVDDVCARARTEQRALALGIARGVAFLHEHHIVHRDIAARNILVSAPLTPRVSDFGMSRVLSDGFYSNETYSTLGPVKWMAPEQLDHEASDKKSYSFKSDVFSFAVTLTEIVNNKLPVYCVHAVVRAV
jgi:serine/threonine protein kinase